MPDSAVKNAQTSVPAASSGRASPRRQAVSKQSSAGTPDALDTDTKLARAARSAQRLAQLSAASRGAATLDLFAEDAERATLQAMNTDVRQGTLAGFELPEVFMAAVPPSASGSAEGAASRRAARNATNGATPGGVQQAIETLEPEPEPAVDLLIGVAPEGDVSPDNDSAPSRPGTLAASATRAATSAHAAPDEPQPTPASLAASLIDVDRQKQRAASATSTGQNATPELDRARATAFADTIDALYAVIADQRGTSTAHSRRMKTMLTIIVCVMLATVATGIAQTVVLLRMSRESASQQQRIEQLMLNQQATLASFFDTDSANVSVPNATNTKREEAADASPIQPVSATARSDAAPKKHAAKHAHSKHNASH